MIKIIDTTLREGNQAPGVSFSIAQTLEIATLLDKLSVDMIECGHPSVSQFEMDRVSHLVRLGLKTPVLAHSRANRKDIDTVYQSGANWIGIFLGVNSKTQQTRMNGRSRDDLLRMIDDSVCYAKSKGLNVRYTAEDASRTDLELLIHAFKIALKAGANRICYADTVGINSPKEITHIISNIRYAFPEAELEVHLHNDRGLAIANAMSAIDAGANWISASVNGIGERCGITDLNVLIGNLIFLGIRSIHSSKVLQQLSQIVAAFARSPIERQHPFVGSSAFRHTSKLHVAAVERDQTSYEWADPSLFGKFSEANPPKLPLDLRQLIVEPKLIPSTELKFHRKGPGKRYVMIDERFIPDCRQYCIVRKIAAGDIATEASHVDRHRHSVDSLYMFLGQNDELTGLTVEVVLGNETVICASPISVFIPAGIYHSYRVVQGEGLYINHVLAGEYNSSLLI